MKHIVFLLILLLIPTLFINTVFAQEKLQEDTNFQLLKKLSDHINANWLWLLVIGVLCIIPGFFIPGLPAIGAIIIIVIVLNAFFLSPITH